MGRCGDSRQRSKFNRQHCEERDVAKVIHVSKPGGAEHLSIDEVDVPEPGPGEVRFKVSAFALNRADILYIDGEHYTELKLPSRVGSEAAGVVDAVGPGVESYAVGDRVSSIPFFTAQTDRYGVQGEYAIVPAPFLAPWPEGFSAVEGCSVWMQYLTAYFALVTVGKLGSDMSALITAASSSAGIGAIQTAKAVGARVVATTRQADKVAFLESVGADHVIVTQSGRDFSESIRDATDGKGVDVVFDPISGSFSAAYMNGLNWEARVIIYGMLTGLDIRVPILPAIRANASVHPFSMFNHVAFDDQRARAIEFVMQNISAGNFRPRIDRVFSLAGTVDAYRYMLSNAQCGKIVVSLINE
jgi:NADPH:quinone reductase